MEAMYWVSMRTLFGGARDKGKARTVNPSQMIGCNCGGNEEWDLVFTVDLPWQHSEQVVWRCFAQNEANRV
eukprot:1153509-Pelagomonas_calceolata.AAC.6